MESASLCVSKWATALSGTGEDDVRLTLEVGAPVDDGCGVAAAAGGRDVPFTDVVALDEIGMFALTVERTVAFVEATDGCESADVVATFREGARALTFG
jgi:hypothetical protein